MADSDDLLTEINRFLEETGMGPTTFGVKAAGNSQLVGRLRRGRDVQMATGRQVRAFIDEYRRMAVIYRPRKSQMSKRTEGSDALS